LAGGRTGGTIRTHSFEGNAITRTIIITLIAAILWAVPAVAQQDLTDWAEQPEPDSTADAPPPADDDADGSGLHWPPPEEMTPILTDEETAAEDEQGRLLTDGEVPVSDPVGSPPADTGPKLPLNASPVVNRRCMLAREPKTDWAVIRLLDDETDGKETVYRWAMPTRILEEMEKIVADRPDAIFRVSGENIISSGRPFLLIRKATVMVQPAPAEPADDEDAPADDPADGSTDEPTDEPDDEPGSSSDVGERLLEEGAGAPVLPPSRDVYEDQDQPPSQAPVDEQEVLHPGVGHMVVSRRVIILPVGQGNWLEAVFEADNAGNEPPLRLLPCAILPPPAGGETGAALSKPIKRYIVTGEITQYRDRRYLLLRKAIPMRDMGEF